VSESLVQKADRVTIHIPDVSARACSVHESLLSG